MVISGLASGGWRRSRGTTQPAKTFTLGQMEAHHNLGKCVNLTAAGSLEHSSEKSQAGPTVRFMRRSCSNNRMATLDQSSMAKMEKSALTWAKVPCSGR